jgi:hypothetical protein
MKDESPEANTRRLGRELARFLESQSTNLFADLAHDPTDYRAVLKLITTQKAADVFRDVSPGAPGRLTPDFIRDIERARKAKKEPA